MKTGFDAFWVLGFAVAVFARAAAAVVNVSAGIQSTGARTYPWLICALRSPP
jgi:hypothetical protein